MVVLGKLTRHVMVSSLSEIPAWSLKRKDRLWVNPQGLVRKKKKILPLRLQSIRALFLWLHVALISRVAVGKVHWGATKSHRRVSQSLSLLLLKWSHSLKDGEVHQCTQSASSFK